MTAKLKKFRHSGESRNPAPLGRTTLGQALPIKYGKARSEKYGVQEPEAPVYGSSGKIGTFGRALTDGPSLIIGRKGSAGAIFLSRDRCWPIDTVYYAEEAPGTYLPYFKYLLDHINLGQLDKSTTIPSLSRDDYNAKEIFVPALEEQHRIVAELETQLTRLDSGITALKRVQANLKRYRASVLKAACEGRLSESDSAAWVRTTLGEIATSIRNGYSHKPDADVGTRIFRISAVRRMRLDVDDVRYLSGSEADYSEFLVEPQDVLFTRYNGSRDFVGVCAVMPTGVLPTVYPDKLIRVRLPEHVLLPKMLAILASASEARAFLESRIRTTAGQSGISGGDLKAVPLRIPPLAGQQRIVAEVERRLSVIEELEATVAANLKRAERLRQSVLGSAFRG